MKTTNLQLGIGTGSGTLLSVIAQLGMYDMLISGIGCHRCRGELCGIATAAAAHSPAQVNF